MAELGVLSSTFEDPAKKAISKLLFEPDLAWLFSMFPPLLFELFDISISSFLGCSAHRAAAAFFFIVVVYSRSLYIVCEEE